MEKLFIQAANTMNYIFLREVNQRDELTPVMRDELARFLEKVDEAVSFLTPDHPYYQATKTEMEEGTYLVGITLEEFAERLKETIKTIAYNDFPALYQWYYDIAKIVQKEEEEEEEEEA